MQKNIATLSSGTDVKGTYSSTLPRDIGRGYDTQRYVNHEIARIAGLSDRRVWRASIFFVFSLDLSINPERPAMASGASDRDARYTFLVSVLENATGIFSRLLGVAREDREGLAGNLSNTTN